MSKRQIAFHVETTGLHHDDRVVSIGCTEYIDGQPTDNTFLRYINPEGKKSAREALAIHKLSDDFLAKQKPFKKVCKDFLSFINGADEMIFHNAAFDIKMINLELAKCNQKSLDQQVTAKYVDLHREAPKFVALKDNKLQTLIDHFKIEDKKRRHKDRPLIDSEIFFEIYQKFQALGEAAKLERAKARVLESGANPDADTAGKQEEIRRAVSPTPMFNLKMFEAPKMKKEQETAAVHGKAMHR